MLIVSARKLVPILFILGGLVSSCSTAPQSSPGVSTVEPTETTVADVSTPAPQGPEITPAQTSVNNTTEFFSSDQLGLCFSYPQGYTQLPYNDTVEIIAPSVAPNIETRGIFWLDRSDAQNRTAEEVADQEVKDVASLNPGRWTVTLGGEEALVLDGMPGQDLVRRVYIVHEQTLYILTFSPTRSNYAAAVDQMEALYSAITSSWAWSACPASK